MRGRKKWIAILAVLTLVIILGVQAVALGEERVPGSSKWAIFQSRPLVYGQDVNIPEGQEIEDLILIGGNAVVAGSVREDIIVVYGNLTLKPTARVGHGVAILGGQVSQDPGAIVAKDIYRMDLGSATLNALLLGTLMLLGLEVLRLVGLVILILAAVMISLMMARSTQLAAGLMARNLWKGILLGLVGTMGLAVATALLALTIIGLPLAILLVLAVLAMDLFGISVLSLSLGQTVVSRSGRSSWSSWASAAIGGTFLALLISVPLLGILVLIAVLTIGVGVALLYLLERNRV